MKYLDKWIEDNVNIWAIDSTEDIKELLVLFSVSQQRELLEAYQKFENGDDKLYECDRQNISDFLKSLL